MRAVRIAPWILAFLTLGVVAAALVLAVVASQRASPAWTIAPFVIGILASSGVGLLLAVRRRENPIGWLLLTNGLILAIVGGLADEYAAYAVLDQPGDVRPGGEWAVLVSESGWPLLFVAFTAIAFVFPDGRLPSSRWRPVAATAVGAFAAMVALSLFRPGSFEEPFSEVASPVSRLPEAVFLPLFTVSALAMLASLVAAAAAVAIRFRRASGLERSQIKLLAYAAALIPAAVVIGWLESLLSSRGSETATTASFALVVLAMPLAIGAAVMRYRLYDVDRLINRSLVYVLVSGLLAAAFVAISLAIGVAAGGGSALPTAVATLTVALAFGALRARVQRLVDRRFSPARYEGLRRIERHLTEVRAGRAAPEATGAALAAALGDPTLELFFWLPDGGVYVDASGRVAEPQPDPMRDLTPVRRGSLQLGAVLHARTLSERPDVLESVIDAAGLAIEIARLRAEVRRRLDEVEQSRARIVTAGYEERRRLERDLHDGAQQRLVSIGLSLRHVQGRLKGVDDGARNMLDGTVAEVTRAIEELRELARGVRPACLDDGLAAALRELASRSPLRTRVDATAERFEERIEAAAYFVASEALTNSVKHARASRVTVSAARRNGSLIVSIRDDGVGGARSSERSGLAGIDDRVAALGGRLSVESPPGRGTVITAELPCAS